MEYYIGPNGELYHGLFGKGKPKENHKYIKREWKNGRWVYYYNTPVSARTANQSKKGSDVGPKKNAAPKNKTKSWIDKAKDALKDFAGYDEKEDVKEAEYERLKAVVNQVNAKTELDAASAKKNKAWEDIPTGIDDKKSYSTATENYKKAKDEFDDKLNDYSYAAKYTELTQKALDEAVKKYSKTPIGMLENAGKALNSVGRAIEDVGDKIGETGDKIAADLMKAVDAGRDYVSDWLDEIDKRRRKGE